MASPYLTFAARMHTLHVIVTLFGPFGKVVGRILRIWRCTSPFPTLFFHHFHQQIRCASLTTVCIPEGVDGAKVTTIMRDRFQIEIGGSLGTLKGKCWRIGLMGYNNRPELVKLVVGALEESIQLSKQ